MCVRQMRPPGRGDFWILKIAHAPSPKNVSKNGFCPRKGVAFLWKAFLQKNFSDARELEQAGWIPKESAPSAYLGASI
jgi:hypothetical protein